LLTRLGTTRLVLHYRTITMLDWRRGVDPRLSPRWAGLIGVVRRRSSLTILDRRSMLDLRFARGGLSGKRHEMTRERSWYRR
jgi:hypothetical protein